MNEHLKYYGKLSLSAGFSFLKIHLMGWGTMMLTVLISIFSLIGSVDFGKAAHLTGDSYFVILITQRPVGCGLLLFLIFSPALYVIFGNKYVLQKVIYRIVKDKSEDTLIPLLDQAITHLRTKQPDLFKKGMDFALVKLKLIHQIRTDSDNVWKRRICTFALKKVSMDDVDFSQDDLDAGELIRMKTIGYLNGVEQPSQLAIWICFAIQWIAFFVIWKSHF